MESIGIRDLRARLASMTRRAASGQRIVVTVDGEPIAQLGPLDPTDGRASLADLSSRGLLMAARRDDRPTPAFSMPMWAGTRIDRLLREVRGR